MVCISLHIGIFMGKGGDYINKLGGMQEKIFNPTKIRANYARE